MSPELDLGPELGMATDLSGEVEIKGSVDDYQGQATFINRSKGWEKASRDRPCFGAHWTA